MIRNDFMNYTLMKTAPIILNVKTRWIVTMVSITPRPLQPPRKGPPRLGGARQPVWKFW